MGVRGGAPPRRGEGAEAVGKKVGAALWGEGESRRRRGTQPVGVALGAAGEGEHGRPIAWGWDDVAPPPHQCHVV